jgi:hypothetical protein
MLNHSSSFIILLELPSSEFLSMFFDLEVGISLFCDVNRIVTRLITIGEVVLRLQSSGLLI